MCVSALVALLVYKGKIPSEKLPYSLYSLIIVLAYIATSLDTSGFFESFWGQLILGFLFGNTFSLMSFCWIEQMTKEKLFDGVLIFLIAYFLSSVFSLVLDNFSSPEFTKILNAGLVFISALLMHILRKEKIEFEVKFNSVPIKYIVVPIATASVFDLTFSLINVSLFDSSFEYILSSVPVWVGSLLASVLLLAFLIVKKKNPETISTFQVVFPLLLAALLLLLLLGEDFGTVTSLLLVTGQSAVSVSLIFLFLSLASSYKSSVILLCALSNVFTKLALLLSFVLGYGLIALSDETSSTLLVITIIISVYLLAIAAFFIARYKRPSKDSHDGLEKTTTVQNHSDKALESVAEEYGFTLREKEVFSFLVRGWGVKQIANQLYISEHTVWGHVKHIYTKLGVSSKQDAINIFEKNLSEITN